MTNVKKTMFVIDGMDGATKNTQAQLLHKSLEEKGIRSIIVSFPNYADDSSILVKRYLDGEYEDTKIVVDEITRVKQISSFYAVDRVAAFIKPNWDLEQKSLIELYNEGVVIICDRYTTSNILHQTANIKDYVERIRYIQWLQDLEYGDLGLPEPTKVLYLDITPDVALENISARYEGENKNDAHENIEHLTNVYNINRSIVSYCGWESVNCINGDGKMRTREDIAEDILEIVNPIL